MLHIPTLHWTFQNELNNKKKDYSINNYNTELCSSIEIFLAINHPIVRNRGVRKKNKLSK